MNLPKAIKASLHLDSPSQVYPVVCLLGIGLTVMLKATHEFLFSPELFLGKHVSDALLLAFGVSDFNPYCM